MISGIRYQVENEGLIICIPLSAQGAYITLDIDPFTMDSILEKWLAIRKDEIIKVPRKRRYAGTLER